MTTNTIYRILKNILKNLRGNIFRDFENYYLLDKSRITYAEDLLYTYNNADFLKDQLFIESYNLGKATDKDNILIGNNNIRWRIHVLCWSANHAKHLEGDFVECGVNTGIFSRAVINYINFNQTGKTFYLLDTFKGLDPRYSSENEIKKVESIGYEKQNNLYSEVKETFKDFNVEIIKGSVPDTLHLVKSKKICYLSIDMNCVIPEVEALEYFWDLLVPGAVIILDDYGYANAHNEQKKAEDAFAKSKGVQILSLPTCQGLLIKP